MRLHREGISFFKICHIVSHLLRVLLRHVTHRRQCPTPHEAFRKRCRQTPFRIRTRTFRFKSRRELRSIGPFRQRCARPPHTAPCNQSINKSHARHQAFCAARTAHEAPSSRPRLPGHKGIRCDQHRQDCIPLHSASTHHRSGTNVQANTHSREYPPIASLSWNKGNVIRLMRHRSTDEHRTRRIYVAILAQEERWHGAAAPQAPPGQSAGTRPPIAVHGRAQGSPTRN